MGKLSKEAAELRDYFRGVADEIEKHNTNVNSAKMVGGGVAAYGGAVGLLGFAFAGVTGGASLFLVAIGGGLAVLGGATYGGANMTRTGIEDKATRDMNEKWNAFRRKAIGVLDLSDLTDSKKLSLAKEIIGASKFAQGMAGRILGVYNSLQPVGASLALGAKIARGINVMSLVFSIYEFAEICGEVLSGDKSAVAAAVRNLAAELDKIARLNI